LESFMSRLPCLLAAALSLPLLLASCDDTAPPSGPGTQAKGTPAARVSRLAASHLKYQIHDRAANASFSTVDPSGCVETFVFVFGSNETVKDGGKPTSGPLAVVQLSQYDFCHNTIGEYFGIAEDAAFEVSRLLDQAHLKATVPGFIDETGVEAPAVVDLTWTGAGDPVRETDRTRLKFPGSMLTQWLKGTFRPAQVSGTVLVGKTNLAANPVDALILRATQGSFEVVRTH
jgi:hypothetical protein